LACGVKMRDAVNVIVETVTCQSRANVAVRQVSAALGLASTVLSSKRGQVKFGSLDMY
jgi:hypothetical protein